MRSIVKNNPERYPQSSYMAFFALSVLDLFIISVAINTCILIQILSGRVFEFLARLISPRSSIARTLVCLHDAKPSVLPRMMMEQLTLWVIVILTLRALSYTSVSVLPFSFQPDPHPYRLIRLILALTTGRFVFIAFRVLLHRDANPRHQSERQINLVCEQRSKLFRFKCTAGLTAGHTGVPFLDLTYCVFGALSALGCLGYHQNLLLGLTWSFMEVYTTSLDCCRLIKMADRHVGSKSYLKSCLLTCGLCVVCRLVMPVVFFALAVFRESPLLMDPIPIGGLFVVGSYQIFYNVVLIYQSIRRVKYAFRLSSSPPTGACSYSLPQGATSIYEYPNMLSNDIVEDIEMVRKELTDSDKSYTHLKNLNYGFLRSFDNRNICCSSVNEDGEKMNTLKTKQISKNALINHIHEPSTKIFDLDQRKNIYHRPERNINVSLSSSNDSLLSRSSTACRDSPDSAIVNVRYERLEEHSPKLSAADTEHSEKSSSSLR